MQQGVLKFCKPNDFWGKITDNETGKDIYFNYRDVESEAKHLLNANKLSDEPLIFTIQESERKKGELQAVNIRLNTDARKVGRIESFNPDTGKGTVEVHNTKEVFPFFIANFRRERGKEDKFIRIEIDEPIVFSLNDANGKPEAKDITKVDGRSTLEMFSAFRDFKQSLKDLCEKAEDEKGWDYINRPRKNMPVLYSYINHTFKRLQLQGKIVLGRSSRDNSEYAYFNTGLVTPSQDEIYGYFAKNVHYRPLDGWGITTPEWFFLEFNTEHSNYRKYFSEDAKQATYFEEADVRNLIFEPSIKIIPNKDHLIRRKSRIESETIRRLDDDGFIEAIKESIDLALKRVRRNYKTAIPHYYEGEIQFLLPLCFKADKAKAVGALVVNRNQQVYEAHTILSLDQALNNARLLAKPDREWLNP